MKKYIKIPPELVDGDHSSIVEYSKVGCKIIGEALFEWLEGSEPEAGEELTLEIIELSDEEFEAMPEI